MPAKVETAFETSAGEDRDAQLDLSALPEQPVAKPPPAPKPIPPNETKPPLPAQSRRTGAGGGSGSVIQLGAFQNQAQAERAWTALVRPLPDVAAMTKLVVPFTGGIRLARLGGYRLPKPRPPASRSRRRAKTASSRNRPGS